jgi:hypothetical protein
VFPFYEGDVLSTDGAFNRSNIANITSRLELSSQMINRDMGAVVVMGQRQQRWAKQRHDPGGDGALPFARSRSIGKGLAAKRCRFAALFSVFELPGVTT